MSLFETQKVTIYDNDVHYSNTGSNKRQPVNSYDTPWAKHVPCTISRISTNFQPTLIMLVSRKNVKKFLPGLPVRGFKVVVEPETDSPYNFKVDYIINKDAYWPVVHHHLEIELGEYR